MIMKYFTRPKHNQISWIEKKILFIHETACWFTCHFKFAFVLRLHFPQRNTEFLCRSINMWWRESTDKMMKRNLSLHRLKTSFFQTDSLSVILCAFVRRAVPTFSSEVWERFVPILSGLVAYITTCVVNLFLPLEEPDLGVRSHAFIFCSQERHQLNHKLHPASLMT